jgi:hypothetical protein
LTSTLYYPFLGIFILYVIGRPQFLITRINKLWSLKVTKYEISVFTGLSIFFGLGALYNYINRLDREAALREMISLDGHYNVEAVDNQKKLIFLCERGIFLYLAFFIMTLVFVKFSDVYGKKFDLEAKLDSLEDKNTSKVNKEVVKEKLVSTNVNSNLPEAGGKMKSD